MHLVAKGVKPDPAATSRFREWADGVEAALAARNQ